jgi:hypothetical protein
VERQSEREREMVNIHNKDKSGGKRPQKLREKRAS